MVELRHASGSDVSGLPSIFEICTPRKDIRDGIVEAELAADLASVAEGSAAQEYADPDKFFASTYPTKGIKNLLRHVLARLGEVGGRNYAVFWLNTSFGPGGKTHALIALLHAAQSQKSDALSEFVDLKHLPRKHVRVAVFDGQSADIANGHKIGGGVMARTPWGEIAYRLAGKGGYLRMDDSGTGSAPGTDTIMELFGEGPVLILLDELAVYLRKAAMHEGVGKQFAAFLTALIEAVNRSPNAALVYTLAAGKEADAYSDENRKLMSELESISSRKATLLNPTEEGETIQILRRRLFESRDEPRVDAVVDAYRRTWKSNLDRLPDVADLQKTVDEFRAGYPLHPEILNTLISKVSTLENFQRVRGMLRLLGHVVHDLWRRKDEQRPAAIHLHHFDMGNEAICLEITARLKQEAFASAIEKDIACDDVKKTSLAQDLDLKHYPNMPPFTTYIARTIFMHTLAFNPHLRGIDDRRLRYSILSPGMETGYIDEALARFREMSLYLDDDLEKPTQFQAEPNLNQAIQRAEGSLDYSDLEKEIDERTGKMFQRGEFELRLFPGGYEDVPDSSGRPQLVIPKYSGVSTPNPESPPPLVKDIFHNKGIGGGIRVCRNNLVFLVAFENGVVLMYDAARRHLAMARLASPDSLAAFADYQQNDIRKRAKSANAELSGAILRCYKYLYYPVKGDDLAYITMDWQEVGQSGQKRLTERLHSAGKIRTDRDLPDNPASLVGRVSGLRNGEIPTLDFRNEFYRATALPMLIGDGAFEISIRHGIEKDVFVYKSGDLLCGKDDPPCRITIDLNSFVYTVKRAGNLGIWPRKKGGGKGEGEGGKKHPPLKPAFNLPSVRVSGRPDRAIRNVLDELRKHDVIRISKMRIESINDVFPFLSTVGRIRECETCLEINGSYETEEGGSFRFDFKGVLNDAEPVLEFVKPQLRAGRVGNISVQLDIIFKDGTDAGWLETLAGRLKLVENDIEISGIMGVQEKRQSTSGNVHV